MGAEPAQWVARILGTGVLVIATGEDVKALTVVALVLCARIVVVTHHRDMGTSTRVWHACVLGAGVFVLAVLGSMPASCASLLAIIHRARVTIVAHLQRVRRGMKAHAGHALVLGAGVTIVALKVVRAPGPDLLSEVSDLLSLCDLLSKVSDLLSLCEFVRSSVREFIQAQDIIRHDLCHHLFNPLLGSLHDLQTG